MLVAVLGHDLGALIIHVMPDTLRLFLAFAVSLADDLGEHRLPCGEGLGHRVGLELDHGLGHDGVEYAGSASPGLGALLDLQTKQPETLGVGFFPRGSAQLVIFISLDQLTADLVEDRIINVFCQIGIEWHVFSSSNRWLEVDNNAAVSGLLFGDQFIVNLILARKLNGDGVRPLDVEVYRLQEFIHIACHNAP